MKNKISPQQAEHQKMKLLYGFNILIALVLWLIGTYSLDVQSYEQFAIFDPNRTYTPEEVYEICVLNPIKNFLTSLIVYGFCIFCVFFATIKLYTQVPWHRTRIVMCFLGILYIVCGIVVWVNIEDRILLQVASAYLHILFILNILLSIISFTNPFLSKDTPVISTDILDDPNSIK